MQPNSKVAMLLLTIWLFVLFLGIFALNDGENQFQKHGVQSFGSRFKRTQEWKNRQKTHLINDVMSYLKKLEAEDRQKAQKVKTDLMKTMTLKEIKSAPKVRRHFDGAPGLDFRREFASDEPNPYIENLGNRMELL